MASREEERAYGLGRGKVFPSSRAASLLHPARRLLQSAPRTVRAASVRPGQRVLEVGSGPGYFSPAIGAACAPGLFVALDLQPEMLGYVRDRTAGRVGCALVAADAARLPFGDAAFDAVFVATMLGEVPDPVAAVGELRRVLVAGGSATFAETRRDSDFIRIGDLQRLVEPAGFVLAARRGPPWQYVATFATRG